MSVENFQQELGICFSTGDQVLKEASDAANRYTEMMKAGQINKHEYIELMADIQRAINVDNNMSTLETKERLNTLNYCFTVCHIGTLFAPIFSGWNLACNHFYEFRQSFL